MRGSRAALLTAVIVTALLLQVSLFDRLPLPGAHPDLLLVTVVAAGFVAGPVGGALTGFAAGLLADLAPPADHTAGRLALVLLLVGYGAGLIEDAPRRSVLTPIAVVAGSAIGSGLLLAVVGAVLADPRVTWPAVARAVSIRVLYDVVLTPFVVPLVLALARRLEPEPFRR